jgi:hypothetical protein
MILLRLCSFLILNITIEQKRPMAVYFRRPLLGLTRFFNELAKQGKDFITYFSVIDMDAISQLVD